MTWFCVFCGVVGGLVGLALCAKLVNWLLGDSGDWPGP